MLKKYLLVSTVILLVSCGGGGGGSGGGGGNDSDSRRTGARILHGVIEGAPVDLVSSVQGIVQTARFGKSSGYAELQSGTHLLNLFRTKDLTSSLDTRQITNSEDRKQTIVFYGDRENFGLRTTLISEDLPEVPDGSSFIRIIHAAVGASSLEVPSATIVAGFGSVSSYGTITPGPVSISILRGADKTRIDGISFTAAEGKAYSVFVSGEVGYLVLSQVLEEN